MQVRSVWIKRSTLALPLLCLIIFGTVIGARLIGNSTGAGAASLVQLPGYVPGLVKTSSLVGPMNTSQSFSVSIGLKLRNADALKIYADNTVRSSSSHTPQHLTPAQVASAFAPLASSQQAVVNYMQSYGFQVTASDAQHLVIGFKGTAGDVESAFHIQLNNYRSSTGQNFYAPASNPAMPADLAELTQSIIGLDNAVHFTHKPLSPIKHAQTSEMSSSSNSVACPGPGDPTRQNPNNGFIPSQIASAYNLNQLQQAGFNGEGQTVALFELDDYNQSDITAYTGCFGGNKVPINRIKVDGGVPIDANGGSIEVELDMEMVLSAAPHLADLDVYETAGQSPSQYIDEWAQIVNDAVPVVSTSWSYYGCEAFTAQNDQPLFAQENSLFMLAAAQGQSIFAASGDLGTNDCGFFLPPNGTPQLAVDDPASQPYVTGVGGTSLSMTNNTVYNGETAWNNGPRTVDTNDDQIVTAGGGGVSTVWPMPSWQQGPGVISSLSQQAPYCSQATSGQYCREVPDVSLNADPFTGYEEYCTTSSCQADAGDGWFPIGGTSVAAPMWAAFMALANEKTLHDGGFDIGFLNPYLYQIDQNAGGTSYANDFHDITTGNNDGLGDGGTTYPATTNYDMATGLGSYNAANLAADLEKLANAQSGSRGAPAATAWYFAEGRVGGGFQEYLTILNPSTQTANVTVQYLFQGQQAQSKNYTVNASSRSTINVNSELGYPVGGAAQSISAIVTSNVGVVVERPMYFSYNGIHSGTDVLGATNPGTSFYFAQGDSSQTSTDHTSEFITILNPSSTATANLTVTYYSGGKAVETDTVAVGPLQRGTTSPTFHGQAAVAVTSDIGVVVERPSYFSGNVSNAGGSVSGAASAVGATTPGTDWLFAEGYTGTDYQEDLVLANFGSSSASATVNLEYTNGVVQSVPVTVAPQSQFYFNVNNYKGFSGATGSVSAEITSNNPIVAERVMYFHYSMNGSLHPGYNDVVGQAGPASQSTYNFAEGAAGTNFNLWLTLQNPNSSSVTVAITIFADNTIIQKKMTLPAHSRSSVLINSIVNPIVAAYPTSAGYSASMTVQSFGGSIVAERPEYFTFNGDTGDTDVIGFTG